MIMQPDVFKMPKYGRAHCFTHAECVYVSIFKKNSICVGIIYFRRSLVFIHHQTLCSRTEDYNNRGVLCDARQEGPLRRNPGNHNRNMVERLPTSADVAFTLSLTEYDTGAQDRSSNMSFRNTLEG